jgi:hypothetical protein
MPRPSRSASPPAALAAIAFAAAADDAELETTSAGGFAAAGPIAAFLGAALPGIAARRPRRLAKIAGQRLIVLEVEADADRRRRHGDAGRKQPASTLASANRSAQRIKARILHRRPPGLLACAARLFAFVVLLAAFAGATIGLDRHRRQAMPKVA